MSIDGTTNYFPLTINGLQDISTDSQSVNILQVNSLTPNRVVVSDGSNYLTSAGASSQEVDYLIGTSGLIQNQLNTKASTSYVDSQNSAQDIVIATKASTSYVDTNFLNKTTATQQNINPFCNFNSIGATTVGMSNGLQWYKNSAFEHPWVIVRQIGSGSILKDLVFRDTENNVDTLLLSENGQTIYVNLTCNYATASKIPIFDSNKKLVSSGVDSIKITYLDNVSSDIQTQLNGKLNLSGNNANQDIVIGTYKVQSSATPTVNNDYTNKLYVDSAISGLGSVYVLKAGDSMSGTLAMGSNKITTSYTPVNADDLTRKGYVDSQDALKLSLTGGVMTGDITGASFNYLRWGRQGDVRNNLAPNYVPGGSMAWYFGTYSNNNTGSFADHIIPNSWADTSGGLTNMLSLNKGGKGIRQFQQTFGSASGFATWYDCVLTDANSADVSIGGVLTAPSVNVSGQTASRVAIFDASKNLVSSSVSSTTLTYLDIGSSLVGLLGLKSNLAGANTFTGINTFSDITGINLSALTASRVLQLDASKNITSSTVSTTTLGFLDATSSVQNQLNSKCNLAGGNTITGFQTFSDETASRVAVFDVIKRLRASSTTSLELSYLSGTTSSVQSQLDARVLKTGDTMSGELKFTNNVITEWGVGLVKEVNSYKIGASWVNANCLDIVGGGTTAGSRSVVCYERLGVNVVPTVAFQVSGTGSFSGSLGIGTTNPLCSLYNFATGTSGWKGQSYFGNQNTGVIAGTYDNVAYLGGHNGALSAWTDIAIAPGGNVGIGQAIVGAYKLNVVGTCGLAGQVDIGVGGNTTPNIKFANSASHLDNNVGEVFLFTAYQGHLGVQRNTTRNSSTACLVLGTSPLEKGEILSTRSDNGAYMPLEYFGSLHNFAVGNVGIGTTNPSYKLHLYEFLGTAITLQTSGVDYAYLIATPDVVQLNANYTFAGVRENVGRGSSQMILNQPTAGGFIQFTTSPAINSATVERMRITANGNVGVGFPSAGSYVAPVSKFTVNASYSGGQDGGFCINATDDITDSNRYNLRLFPYVQAGSQVAYQFRVNNIASAVNSLAIGYNGNVGIGTGNPTGLLHLAQSIAGNILTLQQTSTNANYLFLNTNSLAGVMYVGMDDSGGSGLFGGGIAYMCWVGTTKNVPLGFATNNTERMRITSGGNVGIGTTNPSAKLDVVGSFRAFGNAVGGPSIITSENANAGDAYAVFNCRANNGGGSYWFHNSSTRAGDGGPNTATLRNDVGALRLQGSNGTGMTVATDGTCFHASGDNSYMRYGPNSTWDSYLHVGATQNKVGQPETAQVITTNGNLHLDAGYDREMYLGYYANLAGRTGNFYLYADVSHVIYFGVLTSYTDGNGWVNVSDEREKEDIQPLKTDKSLERILALKPKHYRRKYYDSATPVDDAIKERRHVGFIAQEVQKTNPHCISTWCNKDAIKKRNEAKVEIDVEEDEDVKVEITIEEEEDDGQRFGMSYNDYVVHLVGGMQEQQKQLEADRKEIVFLTQRNQILEDRLAKLEQLLERNGLM